MQLHFLGANRQVTGSCYLLEAAGARLLIDCGMFQERRFAARNRAAWAFDPASLDAVLLTHAHLDHCGLLPRLVADGYRGPIITHHATADLATLVMADSGRLQESAFDDEREDYLDQPLYTLEDAQAAAKLFQPVGYHTPVEINHDCGIVLHEAGHILGSASIEVMVRERGNLRTVVFSGDVGMFGKPLLRDAAPPPKADVLIMESTYGVTTHVADSAAYDDEDQPTPRDERTEATLERIIKDVQRRGGKLLIPTFAVERAQELLYHLARLRDAKRFTHIPVFLDSPLAVDVTRIFKKYPNLLDAAGMQELAKDGLVLGFEGLRLTKDRQQSFAINDIDGPAVILAGSGMCTGGRIVHHLVRYIDEPDSTVLFVGYQAQDTLGRDILEGRSPVRVLDATKPVRARIEQIHSLSGHADYPALTRWLKGFETLPGRIFLTHGEEDAAEALASQLRSKLGAAVEVPDYGDVVEL